jgi:hypothetical protein
MAAPSMLEAVLSAVPTRSELLRKLFVVHPLGNAVDPAKAWSFLDRLVGRNASPTGMFFVADEPNLSLSLVMFREPGAPFLPAGYIQRLAYFHFGSSAAVADNDRCRTTPLIGAAATGPTSAPQGFA